MVCTSCILIAVIRVGRTLIVVSTGYAISGVAAVTGTRDFTHLTNTNSIIITSVRIVKTLVNISSTRRAIANVTSLTDARSRRLVALGV